MSEDFTLPGSVFCVYLHDNEDLDKPNLEIMSVEGPSSAATRLRNALTPPADQDYEPYTDRYLEILDDIGVYHFLDASQIKYATVTRAVLIEEKKASTPRRTTKNQTVAKKTRSRTTKPITTKDQA
jgi:hypothetical protein